MGAKNLVDGYLLRLADVPARPKLAKLDRKTGTELAADDRADSRRALDRQLERDCDAVDAAAGRSPPPTIVVYAAATDFEPQRRRSSPDVRQAAADPRPAPRRVEKHPASAVGPGTVACRPRAAVALQAAAEPQAKATAAPRWPSGSSTDATR